MPESMVDRLYIARQAGERQIHEFLGEVGWGRRQCPSDRLWLSMFAMPLRIDDQLMVNSGEILGFVRGLGTKINVISSAQYARNSYHGFTAELALGGHTPDFFELRHNGFLTSGRGVQWTQSMRHDRQSVAWETVAQFVPGFLRAATAIYEKLSYSYFVRLGLLLADTRGSLLTNGRGILFHDSQEPVDQPYLLFMQDCAASDLREQLLARSGDFLARLGQTYGLQVYELETDMPAWHHYIRDLARQQEQLAIP